MYEYYKVNRDTLYKYKIYLDKFSDLKEKSDQCSTNK